MSCYCGQTHTSLATALACSERLGASQSAPAGNNTPTLGVRSVSPHQSNVSPGEFSGKSRLMGRRLVPGCSHRGLRRCLRWPGKDETSGGRRPGPEPLRRA